MVDIKKHFPNRCTLCNIQTTYGEIRKGIYIGAGCFTLVDCTHPMQNTHIPSQLIIGWNYDNINDMIEYGIIDNYYTHQEQGEKILSKVRLPFIHRIKTYFKNLFNRF